MERGRPRNFDPDIALDRALQVFWRDGFQGASLSTLTEAMGINKPSLYATFGDKESLYLSALKRYRECESAHHGQVLDTEPDARRAVEAFLHSCVRSLTDPAKPGGCFVLNGTADCGQVDTPAAIQVALRQALRVSETMIKERLKRASEDGQLPANTDVSALAAYFFTVLSGLGVQAKSGASRVKLFSVVGAVMRGWPEPER